MALSSDDRGVLVKCPSCGRTNRQGYQHLNRTIRCASCHTTLPAPGSPVDVTSAPAFDALVAQSPLPVLVDFWAPWCGPCRMAAPEFAKIAKSRQGTLLVAKVNTDEVPDVAGRFAIQAIPTFVLFRGGQEVRRASGAMPADQVVRAVGLE